MKDNWERWYPAIKYRKSRAYNLAKSSLPDPQVLFLSPITRDFWIEILGV